MDLEGETDVKLDPRHWPVTSFLRAVTVVPPLLTTLLVGGVLGFRLLSAADDFVRGPAREVSNLVAHALVPHVDFAPASEALIAEHRHAASQVLRDALEATTLVSAVLFDPQGQVIASEGNVAAVPATRLGDASNEGRVIGDFLEIVHPVSHGYVLVTRFNSNRLQTERFVTFTVLALALALSFALSGAAAWGGRHTVSNRLHLMTDSVAQVAVATEQHQRTTVSQSASVQEVRQTIESLADASRRITSSAQEVAAYAGQAREANEALTHRTRELIESSSRISDLLETVQGIATKSELLALNAALEGARAGESGRGFSLVATQMQRLAENIAASVRDIRALVEGVRQAGEAGVLAIEQAVKTVQATEEHARQISLTTRQQQAGAEEVKNSMADLAQLVAETVQASAAMAASAADLSRLSQELVGPTNGDKRIRA
jgi:methyl-accepting chemotaxis protein